VLVRRVGFRRILALEAAAFLLVATIPWLDELIDLPHLLFGVPPEVPRLAECTFESLLTLMLGAAVVVVTRRAFHRILYLESLVVMCAWCRRVRDGTEWLSVEDFLSRQHHARTSHGICEACAAATVRPGF
jgi:hypothetical protein